MIDDKDARFYVTDGDRVLVLWRIASPPSSMSFVERQERGVGVAPSFERVGVGSGRDGLTKKQVEAIGEVWFPGRPDCPGPTLMTREQAEGWVRAMKRGFVSERARV